MGYDIPRDHHGPTPGEIERAPHDKTDDWERRRDTEEEASFADDVEDEVYARYLAYREAPHFHDHGTACWTTASACGVPLYAVEDIVRERESAAAASDDTDPKEQLRERANLSSKDTNPKDAVGVRKWRQLSVIPCTVIWELGVAMLEGARKYGRHNYRVAGVRGSVYYDAAVGHLQQWWEGEDIDPDSGVHHVTKAIASLTVLRDAMIRDKFVDDRPPKSDLDAIRERLQTAVDDLHERYPEAKPAFVEGDQHEDDS